MVASDTTIGSDEPVLYVVAPVVPDLPAFRSAAFSRAGNMYITNVVSALHQAGLPVKEIISFIPLATFPRSDRIFVRGGGAELSGTPVHLISYVNIPLVKQLTIALGVLRRLLSHGRWSNHPRTVYTYNAGLPHGPAVLVAARLARYKTIVSLNDVLEPGHLVGRTWWRRLNYWLECRLIPRFDGYVAVSDQIMKDLAPSREYLRLEGAVTDAALERLGTRLESSPQMFTIAFAGGLDRANGVLEMLEAFRLLPQGRYRLRIAGDGPLVPNVLQAVREVPGVEYLGQLEFTDVLDVYRSADVLVNMRLTKVLSTRYFYPSKMMEFLASGVPVISTCTGHTESEFGSFVFLLYDESAAGLAALIEHVAALPDQERAIVGGLARDYMRTHKTWRAAGQRLAAHIRSVSSQ